MKKHLGIGVVVASAALLLAGCSSNAANTVSQSAATTSDKCIQLPSGDASKNVKVTFTQGKNPTIKANTPLDTKGAERTVIKRGTGSATKSGDTVMLKAAIFSGTTGKLLQSVGYTDNKATAIKTSVTQYLPGLVRSVECLPVGSSAVYTAPVKYVLGSASATQTGIASTEKSLIIVASVDSKVATKATGKQQSAPAGFPKVKLAANGAPTIGSTKGLKPASETKVAVLKQGDGAKITKGSTVTIQYTGAVWKTGKVFDSSWSRNAPISQAVGGFVKGFQKALIGQKVGSQVIVSIPPKDGYGDNPQAGSGIGKHDTMVFVVDILSAS